MAIFNSYVKLPEGRFFSYFASPFSVQVSNISIYFAPRDYFGNWWHAHRFQGFSRLEGKLDMKHQNLAGTVRSSVPGIMYIYI